MSRQRRELEADLERLAADGFCPDPADLAIDALSLLTPPEQISTTDCAAQYRLIPTAEGGTRLWSPTLTPYICGIQDSLDDPLVRVTLVAGAARTGKTMAPENHLFKKMKFGPMTDVLWYLPGEADVEAYADVTFAPMFELHPDIMAKIGKRPSDNKRKLKRIGGRFVQLLPANPNTVRGRQAPFIVGDEIDGFRKSLRANFRQQVGIRARAYGNTGKAYICSHADAGWTDGIGAGYLESSRGLWYWPCVHCDDWSSPCPTAEWRTTLSYERPKGMAADDLLDHVAATACLICPHCGSTIDDTERRQMLQLGKWVFEGEIIAPDGTVTGRKKPNDADGFWIHGTMSPFVSIGQLAREYVGALVFFETTRNATRLREVTAKSLGEVFLGTGSAGKAMDAARLKRRVKDLAEDDDDGIHRLGICPRWVCFITAAVDVGGNKFDVLFRGWGANGESCIIDRQTILADALGQKISPPKVLAHWRLLLDQVIERRFAIAGRSGWAMPVASTGIDTGGAPGATWKAYEFARQMKLGPLRGPNAYKLRLFKGASSIGAPEIGNGTEINRDDQGKPIEPAVTLYVLGVHKLKELTADSMAVDVPGPGYLHLPADMASQHIDEMTNAALVDGKWIERKPNETWDLLVYTEAVRQLLQPDRPGIDWKKPPPWARPINTNPAAPQPGSAAQSQPPRLRGVDRLAALNQRT